MKILYFGIYNSEFSRNKIYMDGLRQNGAEVFECNDKSNGPIKFWRLWKKHQIIGDYDAMIVGYPSQITVPLAKLISKKKVVLDALCSLYEGEVISRGRGFFTAVKTWIVDFLAYQCADLILVESNAQIDFFTKTFFVNRRKLVRVFTGALDSAFFPDSSVQKRAAFTAVFRGQFLPEAGVDIILQSAKILEKENTLFLFIGKDFGKEKLSEKVLGLGLSNAEVINRFLHPVELRNLMLSCHVSLGQFGANSRLERTIPHKAFESLAMGLPYVTGRAQGVSELLTDGKDYLMVNLEDPEDLARKMLMLKNNPDLAKDIAESGLALYRRDLTPRVLGEQILNILSVS